MRRGQLRAGRPPRHRVAVRGDESKTQAHGVRGFLPEARFIFSSPSPPRPPSSSPTKRSWGGQRSLRRVSATQNRGCDGRRRRPLFKFGPAVRNDGSEECEGDSSAQVGHRDTVLLKGNESKTQAHGVRGFLPEARFIFSSPSPQSPPSSSPSKRSWGGQDGPVGLRCQRFHSRISCVRSREHNKQISYLQSITR